MTTRQEIRVLAAAMALGLLLRLWVAQVPLCISADGVFFVQLAEQIAAGGSWFHPSVAITPGYSALIAAARGVCGGSFEQVARYLSAFSSALTVLPAWLVWRSCFGGAAAGFSCLLLAIWPMSVQYGSGVYYEPLCLLCLFAGLHLWVRLERGAHWAWSGAIGLWWGAVTWMKPEALAWSALGGSALLWRRQFRAGMLLAGVATLAYLPQVFMVREHTGKWQIAAKQGVNLLKAQATGEADFSSRLEELREAGEKGAGGSLPGPMALVRRAAINVYLVHRYAIREAWPPVLLVMVAIGIALAWRRRLLGAWLWFPALAALPGLVFLVETRVWHTLFAMASGAAGLAVVQAGGWRRWLLVGLCVYFSLPEALRPLYRPELDAAERQAGLWLRENARSGDVVVDRKPFVAYYAGFPLVWPQAQPGLEGLKQALAGYESAVVVVDNRYFRNSRPEWFAALACPPSWLKELARFTGPDGHEVRLLAYRRSD